MKTWQQTTRYFLLTLAWCIFVYSSQPVLSQTNTTRPQYVQRSFLDTPLFTNWLSARILVTNILETPFGTPTIPVMSTGGATRSTIGTYWSLQRSNQPPWPTRIFPELPLYALNSNHFIVDDRSVDYVALHLLRLEQQATNPPGLFGGGGSFNYSETTNLWLEIPTNGVSSNFVNVIVHNTVQGLPYGLLTKTELTYPYWIGEQTITGAIGNATSTELPQNDRTNLFIWARSGVASTISILTQPLSQSVGQMDEVRFSVIAVGSGALHYQWLFNGTNIYGANESSFAINNVRMLNAGTYSVVISDDNGVAISSPAQLTVYLGTGDPNLVLVTGPRQDFTFRENITYAINDPVQLYGTTTLHGGTVIKLDWYFTNATLQVMGDLVCDTKPYYPAILTSINDESVGVYLGYSELDGPPRVYPGSPPYLDLTHANTANIHDLRIRYANEGIILSKSSAVDIWHSQFLKCQNSIINREISKLRLHNVLFAECESAIFSFTNLAELVAEHVTANVGSFWDGLAYPSEIGLTNCLISGEATFPSPSAAYQNVVFYPALGNFETNSAGRYYLNATSALHFAGTPNINPTLLAALRSKTTYAPMTIPRGTKINGELTLFPQAQRATAVAPDMGYHYDAIDYTICNLTLDGGKLSIIPGTAIGMRSEFRPDRSVITDPFNWTWLGIDIKESSGISSHGFPDKPIVFTDAQFVQEQYMSYCSVSLAPDFWPSSDAAIAPQLDFSFTQFHASPGRYHVWLGYDEFFNFPITVSGLVNWRMKNCAMYGGKVNVGAPDDGFFYGINLGYYYGLGEVVWQNNLFDGVAINLDPSSYWFDGFVNCDVRVEARNNLFRNALWFIVSPLPSSAGLWTMKDNHFDRVQFWQDIYSPLDFDNNAYWPLNAGSQLWFQFANYLQPSRDTNYVVAAGEHDLASFVTPSFQSGPYGRYYLPMGNPLYHTGSRPFEESGLAQYTTRPDQFTEGQELAGHAVNIGLHYVASKTNQPSTANYQRPRDTDNDGVADYVEDRNGNNAVDADETSRTLAQTESGINDAENTKYDDVDLSGSGLVGRIKSVFGFDPVDSDNPFYLIPVTTGEEPDFATFEVPINYDALTNSGNSLSLQMNGVPVTLADCTRATNGNCLLSFNLAFDPARLHFLTTEFRLGSEPSAELHPVVKASGQLQPYYSSNSVQFFEAGSMFDSSGAYLDAKVFTQNANYAIKLFDPSTTPPTLIKTITNNTTTGIIREDWDLTLADGLTQYTGATVRAVFSVADAANPSNTSTNTSSKILTRAEGSLTEWGPNFDVIYFYTPTNNALEAAFAKGGVVWSGMQGVVDTLIKPIWTYDVYASYFNRYTPPVNGEYPGYITKRWRATNDPSNLPTVRETLLPDMTNGLTKQIYIYGHGTNDWMSSWNGDAFITSYDVSRVLKNTGTKTNLVTQNPYRFVFLDGCSTASGPEWRMAFGIYPIDVDSQGQAARNKTGPQAYVGWEGVHAGWLNFGEETYATTKLAEAYTKTLNIFYADWMSGLPLKKCIDNASEPSFGTAPFPVPKNKSVVIRGNGFRYPYDDLQTSKIFIVGYPGLTVNGRDPSLDTDNKYAAPKNIE